jgi:rhodanese-related sulfurtransferase
VPRLKPAIKAVVIEAAIVVLVGGGFALAANGLSPRGLSLTRNYFPAGANPVAAAPKPKPGPPAVVPAPAPEPSEAAQLSERLRGKGLQELKRAQVESLLQDPRVLDGRVILIDARDQNHYQEGHIPGAYPLDPYHPEIELGTVLPLCQAAEEIVVYCTGGECEDSDTAAILLSDAGVPGKKIFVYGCGITEWEAAHLPVETGARHSGLPADSNK